MGKKILVISSSPRKGGNSDSLCDEFIRGAQERGHKTEKLFLEEMNINYCTGCGVCATTRRCIQNDDMNASLNKLIACDVIVMSTPVYFYTMCARMKNFIDRCVPRFNEIAGKEFYFIVVAADTSEAHLERTVNGLRGFTACLPRSREKGILYAKGVWYKGEIERTPYPKEAYEMGKRV